MNAKRIPDITLERYLLKELPDDRMDRIGDLIKSDASLRKRVEAINASTRSILRRYTPETMARHILERTSLPARPAGKQLSGRYPLKLLLVPTLAAAAVAAFAILIPMVRIGYDIVDDPFRQDVTRIKGAPARIVVYRKKNNSAELLGNNSPVREKDLLQIAYYSAEDTHGIILSIDGRGTVTLHYPAPPSTSTRIERNREMLLPRSYELDDAPGFERFIFITSGKPLEVGAVYRAAEKLAKKPGGARNGRLTIDTPCRQTSLELIKE